MQARARQRAAHLPSRLQRGHECAWMAEPELFTAGPREVANGWARPSCASAPARLLADVSFSCCPAPHHPEPGPLHSALAQPHLCSSGPGSRCQQGRPRPAGSAMARWSPGGKSGRAGSLAWQWYWGRSSRRRCTGGPQRCRACGRRGHIVRSTGRPCQPRSCTPLCSAQPAPHLPVPVLIALRLGALHSSSPTSRCCPSPPPSAPAGRRCRG